MLVTGASAKRMQRLVQAMPDLHDPCEHASSADPVKPFHIEGMKLHRLMACQCNDTEQCPQSCLPWLLHFCIYFSRCRILKKGLQSTVDRVDPLNEQECGSHGLPGAALLRPCGLPEPF